MKHQWTNEQIGVTVDMHVAYKVADIPCVSAATAYRLLVELRDDLQARNAELRDDYEQRIADFAKELHRQTLLAEYRQQRIDELSDIRVHRETMANEWRQECEKARSINRELRKRIAELEAENARLRAAADPEAITAEALAQEGWAEKESEAGIVVMTKRIERLDDDLIVSLYIDRYGDETPDVTFWGVDYAGVETMPQLRALVELLQG